MARENFLVIRMDATERQLAEAVATRMGHTESSLIRQLVNEKARRLGLMPSTPRRETLNVTTT